MTGPRYRHRGGDGLSGWSRRPVGISVVEADRLAGLSRIQAEAEARANRGVIHRTDGEMRDTRRLRVALRRRHTWCLPCGSWVCAGGHPA